MTWLALMHLGDITLTLPAAAAVTAWLLASRAWRTALCWSLLYLFGIGLVGASKIAFLGWGTGLPSLGFKALSGHATGATAVIPVLFYLLASGQARLVQRSAIVVGLVLGGLVAVMLVAGAEHTPSEAIAGWGVGALVSLGCVRCVRNLPTAPPLHGLGFAVLAFAGSAWLIKWIPLGYWMARAALALSGNDRLYPWDHCG